MDQQCFDEWDQSKKKCNFIWGVPYGPAVVYQATRCADVLALSGSHPSRLRAPLAAHKPRHLYHEGVGSGSSERPSEVNAWSRWTVRSKQQA
jgi:hypothetical protein